MIRCVAFDMDGTLLSINLSAFIAVLAKDESALLARIGRRSPLSMSAAYGAALLAVNSGHRAEGDRRTNRELFDRVIERWGGVVLSDPVVADAIDYYEREILPDRNDAVIAARPREGAREALDCVLGRGLRVALLTNPGFSRSCIRCRMGWGELSDVPFDLVTYMENSTRCKPSAGYYREALAKLGLAPEEVLMVGNDPKRDFPTPDIGLQTAYVGGGRPVRATWNGSMRDFAASFDEIEERFRERARRDPRGIAQDAQG